MNYWHDLPSSNFKMMSINALIIIVRLLKRECKNVNDAATLLIFENWE